MIKNIIVTKKLKRTLKQKYKIKNKKKYKTIKKIRKKFSKKKKKSKKVKLCVEKTCVYKNPVIGILTVPVYKVDRNRNLKSYLPDSYVKWIQMSGARVVPILFTWNNKKLLSVLNQVNGVLFPGGNVDYSKKNDYMKYIKSFQFIFNYAKNRNNSKGYFPLWGTCLGFQFLITMNLSLEEIYKNFRHNLFIKYIKNKGASKMYLTNKGKNSKFFSNIQDSKLSKKSIYLNHRNGYPILKTNECWYKKYLDILTYNYDINKIKYITTFKYKKYPFYGVQYHPEKIMFEWLDPLIPHSQNFLDVSKKMSEFFVKECKKSNNILKDKSLLISYYHLYSRSEAYSIVKKKERQQKNNSIFEQSYYFKQ